MSIERRSMTILIAEDDPDDRLLLAEAFNEAQILNDLRFVQDGGELLEYLCRTGKYTDPASAPRPGLVLIDLNMPRKDGREALKEIKAIRRLRLIPMVVLTTSRAEEDVLRCYDLGVSGFIVKPLGFDALVTMVRALGQYWIDTVEIPEIDDQAE